ncbi:hypothetical protein RGR602_CH03313 [Rhizobium gallicum bv. gallicum R602sp]|uniref:Uncharacterized protein n=1 Tax=Rhizobium gallicum bv. gallicum R602sp TaxID=1041138 RepID=A0A0B4X815_9HYPH|nr:hypothetical protein RGR602_CH03313 [Rhizobium gallicum bv. gallicum R602sp]
MISVARTMGSNTRPPRPEMPQSNQDKSGACCSNMGENLTFGDFANHNMYIRSQAKRQKHSGRE